MANVKPIPDGYHTITPYLTIKGASEAMAFYKKAFGAEETTRMSGPDGKSVMHAEMKIGDSLFMLGEEWPGMSKGPISLGGSPVGLFLYVQDVDAAYQRAVSAGATSEQPPTDMFWGDRYAKLKDPFGHQWSIGTHKKDLTPAEIEKGQKEWMAQMGKKS